MILQKDFEYTPETGPVSLPLYRRAAIRPSRIAELTVSGMLCAAGMYAAVEDGNMRLTVFLLLVMAAGIPYILLNKSDEKYYLASQSPDDGEKCWSTHRTITLNDDHVLIHAPFSNPDLRLRQKDLEDEDFMEYVRETDEMMADREYYLRKFRCYENEDAFLLLRKFNNESLPLLKSWFTAEETATVREYFRSRMGRHYTDLTGKCR